MTHCQTKITTLIRISAPENRGTELNMDAGPLGEAEAALGGVGELLMMFSEGRVEEK
jgi:hypothetical protein